MLKKILLTIGIVLVLGLLFWLPVQNAQWQRTPVGDYLFQPNATGFSLFRNQEPPTLNFLSPYNDTYLDINGKKEAYLPIAAQNDSNYVFTTSQSPLIWTSWARVIDNWLGINSPWAKLETPFWRINYEAELIQAQSVSGEPAKLVMTKTHQLKNDNQLPKAISATLSYSPQAFIFEPLTMTAIKNQEVEPRRFEFFNRLTGQELQPSTQQGANVVIDHVATKAGCLALRNPADAQFLLMEIEPQQRIILDETYNLLEIFTPVNSTMDANDYIVTQLKLSFFKELVDLQKYCQESIKNKNVN